MVKVGIRELKQKTSELIRRVRERKDEILVTYHGEVVARIISVAPGAEDAVRAYEALDRLAAEIGSHWPNDVSAADAVSDGRR